jgi:hypothetical protein
MLELTRHYDKIFAVIQSHGQHIIYYNSRIPGKNPRRISDRLRYLQLHPRQFIMLFGDVNLSFICQSNKHAVLGYDCRGQID